MVTASWLVFSQVMNFTASAGCFDWLVTALAEPPQLPVAGLAGSHCGIGAIIHLPAVSGALPARTPGAQTAESQPISAPELRAAFHSGVYIGLLLITPDSTSPPQYSATFSVAASSMVTFQASPLTLHHDAPACCASPVNKPASFAEKVPRYFVGSAARTFAATSAYSALSLIHISEPTRLGMISYAVFC